MTTRSVIICPVTTGRAASVLAVISPVGQQVIAALLDGTLPGRGTATGRKAPGCTGGEQEQGEDMAKPEAVFIYIGTYPSEAVALGSPPRPAAPRQPPAVLSPSASCRVLRFLPSHLTNGGIAPNAACR